MLSAEDWIIASKASFFVKRVSFLMEMGLLSSFLVVFCANKIPKKLLKIRIIKICKLFLAIILITLLYF